jgi:hypothetical protein
MKHGVNFTFIFYLWAQVLKYIDPRSTVFTNYFCREKKENIPGQVFSTYLNFRTG